MDCKYSLNALTSKPKTIHHRNVGAKWIACFSKHLAKLFWEPFCRILSVSFVCAHGPSVENDGGGMGMPASCDTSDGSVSPNGLQWVSCPQHSTLPLRPQHLTLPLSVPQHSTLPLKVCCIAPSLRHIQSLREPSEVLCQSWASQETPLMRRVMEVSACSLRFWWMSQVPSSQVLTKVWWGTVMLEVYAAPANCVRCLFAVSVGCP